MGHGTYSGNHVCLLSEAAHPYVRSIEEFARRGIARGQQVLWLLDDDRTGPLADVFEGFVRGGDGGAMMEVATVGSASELYLDGDGFDIDAMVERYRTSVDDSVDSGYTGLRVLADTSWLAQQPALFGRFVRYEHRVNDLFTDGRFAALCHYDPHYVPSEWLETLRDAHPLHLMGGSVSVRGGACRVIQVSSDCAAVAGELDYLGAAAVASVLTDSAAAGADFHVDLGRLTFIDVAGARVLVETARSLHSEHRLVVHNAPRLLPVILDSSGWGDETQLVLAGTEPMRS